MNIAKRISNLLCIKSLVTLASVGIMLYMIFLEKPISDELKWLTSICITSYFTTQANKKDTDGKHS